MAEEPITLRLRLIGYALAIKESWAVAAATKGMGTAADATEKSVGRLHRRSFLMNQVLFTMRRYIYQGTLALTAMGAAAGVFGLKFDTNMEKAQIGMEFLLKSEQAAKDELRFLWELARDTPFQFQPLTETARTMLAFGKGLNFGVNETNRLLMATADVVSVLGGSQEVIDRITYAFGQMLVKGRVMGEELRQLYNANIPASRYLAEAFNLNADQLSRIADLNIPAREGIAAILTGIEREYRGAAEELSKTVWGQTSTLIDSVQQLLGMIFMAPFLLIQKNFPHVLDVLQEMTEVMQFEGFYAMVKVLDDATVKSGALTEGIRTLDQYFRNLWVSSGLLIEALTPFVKLLLLATWATLELTNAVVGLINKGGEPLIWVIRLLVFWMVIERITMKLVIAMTKRETAAKIVQEFWTRRLNAAYRLSYFLKKALIPITYALTQAELALNAAFYSNPIVGVIVAIVALTATLVYLHYRFERFRKVIDVFLFMVSPLTFAIVQIRDNWEGFTDAVDRLWKLLVRFYNWLEAHDLDLSKRLKMDWGALAWNLIPGGGALRGAFQYGGMAGVGGRYLVGEHGPEIVRLPAGASVKPVAPSSMDWRAVGAAGINLTIVPAPVYLDGREVSEVVFKHRTDRIARR